MDALLIIDYQRAVFLGSPPAYRAEEVADTLRTLAVRARTRGMPVLFLRHCEAGTTWDKTSPGWQFPEQLLPERGDEVIDKLSCDGFRDTGLSDILRARSIERLFIGGYATEFCVDTTIRAAASRAIHVVVVSDAHTTRERAHLPARDIIAHHNWVWSNMTNPGYPIAVCPAAQLISE